MADEKNVAHPDPTPEPNAGDVETLAEELWANSASPGAAPTDTERDLAHAILASDWLANQRSAAREPDAVTFMGRPVRSPEVVEFTEAVCWLNDDCIAGLDHEGRCRFPSFAEPDASRVENDNPAVRSVEGHAATGDVGEGLTHEEWILGQELLRAKTVSEASKTMEALCARRTRSAREQGRAESDAEWAAAVEEVTEHDTSRPECNDDEGYRCPTCTTRRALLTADRTKALDAVKAQAAREALLEAADELDRRALGGTAFNAAAKVVRARAGRDTDGGAQNVVTPTGRWHADG